MQRSLIIEYDFNDDFAVISPVKRCDLESFNLLTVYLFEVWQGSEYQINEKCQLIMHKISGLLPRLDIKGYGIDIKLINTENLESLFIGVVENNQLTSSKLIKLNEIKQLGIKKEKKPGEALTPADVPIPSSGIEDADLMATLIGLDDNVQGAAYIYNNFDAQFINGMIMHLNELRRDPQGRLNEYLNQQFEEWKRENQQVYRDALFGE